MTDTLSIALAQINPIVGDITGNVAMLLKAREQAHAAGADLVIAPELCVSGYPPEDLVLKEAFVGAVAEGVAALAAATGDGGPGMVVGAPWRNDDGGRPHNSVVLLDGGDVVTVRHKHNLPNYGVFDEKRVFTAGPPPGPVNYRGVRLGLCVCEDIWEPDVCETLEESGAEILVVPNGSPFEYDKPDLRLSNVVARVTETGLPMIYLNQVGGQDELVFDGSSFVLNQDRSLAVQLPAFEESLVVTEWRRGKDGHWACAPGPKTPALTGYEAIYEAMTLGLRDYVTKNGFPGVVLGLSGGIDSALSAAVAVDALGPEAVHCLMMPSPFTSGDSLEDAAEGARQLGVRLSDVPIAPAMGVFDDMLKGAFGAPASGVTKENIQSRIRGLTLMAVSNSTGAMLLTTGNKSEMSVGYATIYGDMCGGYSVLKDIYKTDVFALCRWRNEHKPKGGLGPAGLVMPDRVITKPPSAELREDQKDEDSLPPYDELDNILKGLIEEDLGVAELVVRGHDAATLNRVWRLLEMAEYKRRQAPPGVKISARAFGRDRRYPITNGFRGSA